MNLIDGANTCIKYLATYEISRDKKTKLLKLLFDVSTVYNVIGH